MLKVYNWLISRQQALYPPRCALCGQAGVARRDLCPGCLADLPHNPSPCHRCGIPLSDGARLCGPCNHNPPPFDSSVIPFRYGPPLDYLLQQLKFHQRLHLAPLLGGLLAEAILHQGRPLPELILPVPLHPTRLRERGYNQALELARPVARQLALPVDWHGVARQRQTQAQTSLQGRERRKNLRNAFVVQHELPRHVALVDDVVTTGATVSELATTLKRSGVERVEIWAIARAGKQ